VEKRWVSSPRVAQRRGTGRRPILRGGFTLVELLVVVSIMMLLVVMAVPRMRPAMENRRVREAARAINVYLSSARNRAIENGRPWGVAVVRDANSPLSGVTLIQVESPAPYAGDMDGATIRLQDWTPTGLPHPEFGYATLLKAQIRGGAGGASQLSPGLLRWGDRLQINSQGPVYRLVDDRTDNSPPNASYPPATSTGADFPITPADAARGYIDFSMGADTNFDGWIDNRWLTLVADDLQTYIVPWPTAASGNWSGPVAFTIFRQPVTSSVTPLELPRNVGIDLWYSGTTSSWFANTATVSTSVPWPTIMFSSTGSVDRIGADPIGVVRVTEPIYLLVGRRDRINPNPTLGNDVTHTIPAVAEDGLSNLSDQQTNFWVAVNPQTGYVVCAEVAAGANIAQARRFASEFQSMGGR
jgi:type II secretory pathway pseudopilin PulG